MPYSPFPGICHIIFNCSEYINIEKGRLRVLSDARTGCLGWPVNTQFHSASSFPFLDSLTLLHNHQDPCNLPQGSRKCLVCLKPMDCWAAPSYPSTCVSTLMCFCLVIGMSSSVSALSLPGLLNLSYSCNDSDTYSLPISAHLFITSSLRGPFHGSLSAITTENDRRVLLKLYPSPPPTMLVSLAFCTLILI